jgi:hypothetical protein
MSSERPDESSVPPASSVRQAYDHNTETSGKRESSEVAATRNQATVIVRGEAVTDQNPDPSQKEPSANDKAKDKKESSGKEVSEAKIELRNRLPALKDDANVGVQKEQVVVRDGKPDLAFTGTLLASAGPPSTGQERWEEYRIYATNAGKHVFSKVTRSVFAKEQDRHEAEIFEPSPSSVPAQLLRSARDLTRSRPFGWPDAAVAFFGYNPLAKALYRKLGDQFEEHIS